MILAHRGYFDKYIPENSMTAFIRCVDKNIPIELDVHLTKDKRVVVFHDYNLFRMTGINKNIEDITYNEIKKLKLGKTNEHIPLLEDVLKKVGNRVYILIELKNKIIGPLEDELLKVVQNYSNYAFQTFKLKSIYYLRDRTNKKLGLLIMNKLKKKLYHNSKIDFISHNLITINSYKANKELYIFTINNNNELKEAYKYTSNVIANICKLK